MNSSEAVGLLGSDEYHVFTNEFKHSEVTSGEITEVIGMLPSGKIWMQGETDHYLYSPSDSTFVKYNALYSFISNLVKNNSSWRAGILPDGNIYVITDTDLYIITENFEIVLAKNIPNLDNFLPIFNNIIGLKLTTHPTCLFFYDVTCLNQWKLIGQIDFGNPFTNVKVCDNSLLVNIYNLKKNFQTTIWRWETNGLQFESAVRGVGLANINNITLIDSVDRPLVHLPKSNIFITNLYYDIDHTYPNIAWQTYHEHRWWEGESVALSFSPQEIKHSAKETIVNFFDCKTKELQGINRWRMNENEKRNGWAPAKVMTDGSVTIIEKNKIHQVFSKNLLIEKNQALCSYLLTIIDKPNAIKIILLLVHHDFVYFPPLKSFQHSIFKPFEIKKIFDFKDEKQIQEKNCLPCRII